MGLNLRLHSWTAHLRGILASTFYCFSQAKLLKNLIPEVNVEYLDYTFHSDLGVN